ncbi:MAG: aminotransferase class V-fold PLP-dependent enzyme [Proteobacteria bacterium]|nr:aminotransferase class V-fold PLP-dependent enzyme [Pseudomonadota bacterium]
MSMAKAKTPIYLDYQATTPLDARVLDAMTPFLAEKFGNPHSVSHRFGWEAMAAVDVARGQVAGVIGAEDKEITFLSGATEANNLAIKGVMAAFAAKRPHMVTLVTEHKCVIESARYMEKHGPAGIKVTYLGVRKDGLIDLDRLARAITDKTALVSVMAVNNEIGVIQPLAEIGALCRKRGVLFHTDAAQAFGRIPLDVKAMKIDLMSISGHKIYGPKGIGAIYVRARPRVPLVPQMSGGGQERGMRPGTLAPAQCVGLGAAAAILAKEGAGETLRITALAVRFREKIEAAWPEAMINGSLEARYQGNLNMVFPGIDGDMLIAGLRDLAVSSGAACASAETGPSYVLKAIGLDDALADSSIRFGFGRYTSRADADFAADQVIEALNMLGPASGTAPKKRAEG